MQKNDSRWNMWPAAEALNEQKANEQKKVWAIKLEIEIIEFTMEYGNVVRTTFPPYEFTCTENENLFTIYIFKSTCAMIIITSNM